MLYTSQIRQVEIQRRLVELVDQGLPERDMLALQEMVHDCFGMPQGQLLFSRTLNVIALHMALNPINTKANTFDNVLNYLGNKILDIDVVEDAFTGCSEYLFEQEVMLRSEQRYMGTRPVAIRPKDSLKEVVESRAVP